MFSRSLAGFAPFRFGDGNHELTRWWFQIFLYIFHFHPEPWGNISNFDEHILYFSDGLVKNHQLAKDEGHQKRKPETDGRRYITREPEGFRFGKIGES